jgi:aspartokinase/homoserine dehydrogenase 1
MLKALIFKKNLSVIAVVGEGTKKHTGVSGKLFSYCKNGINIVATARSSEFISGGD